MNMAKVAWRRFLLAYVYLLAVILATGIGVGMALGAPWLFMGVVLAICTASLSIGAWFALRTIRSR